MARKRMLKWRLDVTERQMIQVPVATKFLSVAVQNEYPVLYGLAFEDETTYEPAIIRMVTTGDPIEIAEETTFIGTAVIKDWFVAHVFEVDQNGQADTTHTRVPQDFALARRDLQDA